AAAHAGRIRAGGGGPNRTLERGFLHAGINRLRHSHHRREHASESPSHPQCRLGPVPRRGLSALDDKERRKYFELVSRATPRAARSAPAPAPASALSSAQKERLRALLQKAISEGEKTSLKSRGG